MLSEDKQTATDEQAQCGSDYKHMSLDRKDFSDAAKQLEAKRGNEKRSQSGWGDKNAAHWNQNPDRICSLSYAPYERIYC